MMNMQISSPSSSPVGCGRKHERGELPSDELFGQGDVSHAEKFGAAPGRKGSRSLESHACAAEKFVRGSIGKAIGGEGRRSLTGDRMNQRGSAVNIRVICQHGKEYLVLIEDLHRMTGHEPPLGKATAFQEDDEGLSIGARVTREAHIPSYKFFLPSEFSFLPTK